MSLRTVARAGAHLRREFRAEARATIRFETRPGQQLQIDFGERRVEISGEQRRVSFFVTTLGYSRRLHVRAFDGECQESWFEGMESVFRTFGGVTEEVLLYNARALVLQHDPACETAQRRLTPGEPGGRPEPAAPRPSLGLPGRRLAGPWLVPRDPRCRDLVRRVGANCTVEVDGSAYSVPWCLIDESVRVTVTG